MSLIISQPGAPAQAHPDEAARRRWKRLAKATAVHADVALAYLSAIDPLMFEIVMDAADMVADTAPCDETVPVCGRRGGQLGIFLDSSEDWQHFHGDGTTAGTQVLYDPGHPAEVTWLLPGEQP